MKASLAYKSALKSGNRGVFRTAALRRSWHAARHDCFAPRLRGAFTIFEMLLVMAILVTILGIVWPALDRLHGEYRLRQGGQLVQVRLSAARVHAIDTGFVYEFRYEPGGQRFLVIPHDQSALTGQAAGQSRRIPKVAGRLPSPNAQFDLLSTGSAPAQQISNDWLNGIPNATEFGGVNWSAPVLFYPDGSAGAAQLIIRDHKSEFVTLTIRALTGGVRVSKIEKGAMR